MVTHALAHVRRVLHPATQLFFGSEVQLAQQALLPAIPQGFVGGANIRHRQADQIAQAVFRLNFFRELLNDFRVLNVPTLRGDRHQQVMAHQPGDQLRFARIETVQFGKFQHVLRAQHRVIAAAALGDVVEQGGNQDQFRMGQARPQLDAQRVAGARLFFGKALQLEHHADGVFIHRVGVEQVELHLPDDVRPLRHIGPQHAVAVHRQQPAAVGTRMAEHAQEQRARFRDVTQRLRQMAARVAQMAQGGGVDPGDGAVAHHGVEHPQDRFRLADKQRFVAQIDKRTAQLEFVIDRARLFVRRQGQNGLVEQLQQHLVQLGDPAGDAEEILHHLLNRLVTFPLVIQALRHAELAVKQQTVIVAGDLQMQGKADAPQQVQTLVELVTLRLGQEAKADHLVQRGGAEMATGDPL